MLKIELDLKKKILVVDLPEGSHYQITDNLLAIHHSDGNIKIFKGKYKFLCKGLTEYFASELIQKVKTTFDTKVLLIYKYYSFNDSFTDKAKEAIISAVEAKGFYWLENPQFNAQKYENIMLENGVKNGWNKRRYDNNKINLTDIGSLKQANKKWQEAESKTFKNPLIFEIINQ